MLTVADMVVSLLDLRMLMEEGMVVSPLDRRTPMGQVTVGGRPDLTMLTVLGNREDEGASK